MKLTKVSLIGYEVGGGKLYLDDTRTKIVPEGDPAARILWLTPGSAIPPAPLKKFFGLSVQEIREDIEVTLSVEPVNTSTATPAPTVEALPRTWLGRMLARLLAFVESSNRSHERSDRPRFRSTTLPADQK